MQLVNWTNLHCVNTSEPIFYLAWFWIDSFVSRDLFFFLVWQFLQWLMRKGKERKCLWSIFCCCLWNCCSCFEKLFKEGALEKKWKNLENVCYTMKLVIIRPWLRYPRQLVLFWRVCQSMLTKDLKIKLISTTVRPCLITEGQEIKSFECLVSLHLIEQVQNDSLSQDEGEQF